jgi:hypothetical protein
VRSLLIKSLQGKLFKVDHTELYIKPFFKDGIANEYSICTNGGNVEIIIVTYSDKEIAKHMLKLLDLYKKHPCEVNVLSETTIARDLWLIACSRYKVACEKKGIK